MEVKWSYLHLKALPPLYFHSKNLVIAALMEVVEVVELKTPYSRGTCRKGEFEHDSG